MFPPTHLHSQKEKELSGREGYIEHVCQEIWRELHLALFAFHAQNNLQKSKFCTARYCVQPLLQQNQILRFPQKLQVFRWILRTSV